MERLYTSVSLTNSWHLSVEVHLARAGWQTCEIWRVSMRRAGCRARISAQVPTDEFLAASRIGIGEPVSARQTQDATLSFPLWMADGFLLQRRPLGGGEQAPE
ncbi:hypothetical protein LSTR_LSTR001716 [Laodelphax striatellus]|uniref:Uncharacterized protein n=1 Tax=Laodelphax striatellus TaxID=195883 RepID=A0A482XBW1_LAOST|nr:hypothetical protein LSTR_LSTR001716 [Laodelphax striatellus]